MIVAIGFDVLLATALAVALLRGGRAERTAALASAIGATATILATAPVDDRFLSFNARLLVIDGAVAAAYVATALRSSKFWPIWGAACQMLAALAALVMVFPLPAGSLPNALGEQFWGWPPLLLIILFSLSIRRERRIGPR